MTHSVTTVSIKWHLYVTMDSAQYTTLCIVSLCHFIGVLCVAVLSVIVLGLIVLSVMVLSVIVLSVIIL